MSDRGVPRSTRWPLLATAFLFVSCTDRPSPSSSSAERDGGTSLAIDSTDAAASAPVPVELQFILSVAAGDAGTRDIPLSADEKPEIEPTTALRLRSNLALSNHRIRVFDEVDRAMVSDDVGEDSAGGIDYRITFHNPLKRGHRYAIVVDGQSGPLFSDSTGRTHPEQRFELKVSGEREKSKPAPAKRRRRR